MRTKYLLLLMVLVFSISLLPIVSTAPPVTQVQQITSGYIITDSAQTLFKLGQDYQYNFFVTNITNGALKINDSVTCKFFLANSTGKVIFAGDVLYHDGTQGYWGVDIDGGNFSQVGFYNYGTRCNSTSLAGAIAGLWEVTKTGIAPTSEEVEISKTAIYFILILSLTFICGGFMFMGKELWTNWLGIFMMSIGFIFMYYDLIMVNMYINTIGTTGQAVEGIFLIFARFIKLLPYVVALIVGFAIVKMLRGATSKKKSEDGWDDNKY
jgi:hypothetical protein